VRICCWVCLLATLACAGVVLLGRHAIPAEPPAIEEAEILEEDRQHWAFQPLRRPGLPQLTPRVQQGCRGPIDLFIRSAMLSRGLKPAPPADRQTLIRRLTLDLTGLPPSPRDLEAFVADPAADAYESLVSRLLASVHHGERLAQPWLDLARFADTDGFEHDNIRANAWQYRDWVIQSINQDMPYDRFVALQLAGDELEPQNPAARIATMFCLSGPDMPDINSQEERLHQLLNEMTSTVSAVLMGLQMECAQCHDHKYDPLSQADFYRLRSVFEPAVQLVKNKSVGILKEKNGTPPQSYLMVRGDFRRQGPAVSPAFPRIANPGGRQFESSRSASGSSGRRSQLADWLTRPDHLLTSRVIVNRVWQHHFGRGLVDTPSDFGVMGGSPSHPELLDYLATELVESGWSLKRLHFLIVTSATYRQAGWLKAGAAGEREWRESLEMDPANRWLSRFPRLRLEGETLRDVMLASAGILNTERGGPGVRPPLPAEIVNTLRKGQWEVTPEPAGYDRRSIYLFARRNLRFPILEAFDRPDANRSCSRRSHSTTAPQGLLLMNSEFSLTTARRLAGIVLAEGHDEEQFIVELFRRTLSRRPGPGELQASLEFLDSQSALVRREQRGDDQLALPIPGSAGWPADKAAAASQLSLILFNMNEFLYID
jgi:hypothetical protein